MVPLFRKQIAAGGPITLTHADITRYFMTIPEAAQLVIQAGSMGQGGEVYVLDMGKPVKIVDLARRMVHLSGLELRDEAHPDGDIAIEVVGLRPGEKLYEELLIGDNVEGTSHPLIMRAYEHEVPWAVLTERLANWTWPARPSIMKRCWRCSACWCRNTPRRGMATGNCCGARWRSPARAMSWCIDSFGKIG